MKRHAADGIWTQGITPATMLRALDHYTTKTGQFSKSSESCFDTEIVSGMV